MNYQDESSTNYDAPMLSVPSFSGKAVNKRLDPTHIDVNDEDNSFQAKVTRTIATVVSRILKPRQILVILRVLKAITFCTLCLTIVADLMFIFWVELKISDDVSIKLGGTRDKIIRAYGTVLAGIAVLVELDMTFISRNLSGLKPFIARSIMLLFIASVSGVSPMIGYEKRQNKKNNYNNNYAYDDDDDGNAYNNYSNSQGNSISDEVPGSTVAFQAMTSFVLFGCACAYFLLGILCLDRFTARAFLADDDQVAAAISATAIRDQRRRGSFDSYDNDPRNSSYNSNGNFSQGYSNNNYSSPERSEYMENSDLE